MSEVTATEAARKFADLLDAVEHDGERYTITRRGRAVAHIEPVTRGRGADAEALLRRHRPTRGGPMTSTRSATCSRSRAGTTSIEIHGVGPIIAAMIIAHTGDITRFPSCGHYASDNAIAPIEASSAPRARHRLNQRGNRQLNWAIHTIAVTQLRYDTAGRRFYDRKVAEGETTKEALRASKRRLSDVVYRHLVADARRRALRC